MKKNLTDWLNGLGVPDETLEQPEIEAPEIDYSGAVNAHMPQTLPDDVDKKDVLDDLNAQEHTVSEIGAVQELKTGVLEFEEIGAFEEVEEFKDFKNFKDIEDIEEFEKIEAAEKAEKEKIEEVEEIKEADEISELGEIKELEEQKPEDLKNEELKNEDLENREPEKSKQRRFLTEQDELQNLADAMLLDDKKDEELQPELYNYSVDDIQQLEDYVEQLENLLDEQEEVLREEIKNSNTNRTPEAPDKHPEKNNKKIENQDNKNLNDDDYYYDNINAALNIGSSADAFQEIVVRERDTEFTQKLHGALHNRKVLAIEKTGDTENTMAKRPKRRLKIAVFCAILLAFALAAAFGTLLYLRNKFNVNLNSLNYENSQDKDNYENNGNNNKNNEKIEYNENLKNDDLNYDEKNNLNVNLSMDLEKDLEKDLKVNEKSGDTLMDNSVNSHDVINNVNPVNPVKPVTYEEYIEAGSMALNKKNWDEAILNFHKALNLNKLNIKSPDITPMIGLAGAYYEKGMFFDSLKIINEAKNKFPKNSTVEFMRRLVRRAR